MSYTKDWNRYYKYLESKHKEKYDALNTSLVKAENEFKKKQHERDELQRRVEQTEYWKESIIHYKNYTEKYSSDEYTKMINLRRQAESSVVGYNSIHSSLSNLIDDINKIKKTMTDFRKAVTILYNEPPADVTATNDVEKQCSVCMENLKNMAMPCGHLLCARCIDKVKKCPCCKKPFNISKVVKIYY